MIYDSLTERHFDLSIRTNYLEQMENIDFFRSWTSVVNAWTKNAL